MFEFFLQIFPACACLVALFYILADNRNKEDARVRRTLHGRHVIIGDRLRVLEENGESSVDIHIPTYFDELPVSHWDGRRY